MTHRGTDANGDGRRRFDSHHVTAAANNDWVKLAGIGASFIAALLVALILFLVNDFFADREQDIAEIKTAVTATNSTVNELAKSMAVVENQYLTIAGVQGKQWRAISEQGGRLSRLEGVVSARTP